MFIKRYTDLSETAVSHVGSTVKKRVYVQNGNIPHMPQLATAVIPPHTTVPMHTHATLYECFFICHGTLSVIINAETMLLTQNDFFCAEPQEPHELTNPTDEETTIVYWGVTKDTT